MNVTAIVHTRNSAATLDRALRSLAWAAELIIVDMGSTDLTREIAERHNARIVQAPEAPRVDGIRNRYLAEASHEWVFVLDSDEYLADDAAQALERLLAEHSRTFDAFALPRFNQIGDQILRGSGWYPDHQIRFFRRGTVEWSDTIHQPPRVVSGLNRLHHLRPPECLHIHHQNYRDLGDFIQRQVTYALNDRYTAEPAGFELSDVLARAYRALAERRDVAVDGDLSHALAMIMAWDQIIRGLLQWERLEPRPPLGAAIALPIAAARLDPVAARQRGRRLHTQARLRSFLSRHPKLFAVLREARRRMQALSGAGPRA
jgi:glycosyltransferase involved in cell wall biosynthesis